MAYPLQLSAHALPDEPLLELEDVELDEEDELDEVELEPDDVEVPELPVAELAAAVLPDELTEAALDEPDSGSGPQPVQSGVKPQTKTSRRRHD